MFHNMKCKCWAILRAFDVVCLAVLLGCWASCCSHSPLHRVVKPPTLTRISYFRCGHSPLHRVVKQVNYNILNWLAKMIFILLKIATLSPYSYSTFVFLYWSNPFRAMFLAAFISRSCVMPHEQRHSFSSFKDLFISPQSKHVFDVCLASIFLNGMASRLQAFSSALTNA